jgi:hypothetical protein
MGGHIVTGLSSEERKLPVVIAVPVTGIGAFNPLKAFGSCVGEWDFERSVTSTPNAKAL